MTRATVCQSDKFMRCILLVIACLAICPPLAAQRVFFAEGPDAASLRLLVFDERRPGLPAVVVRESLHFLPIELTNRLPEASLRDDRPRLDTVDGLTWVQLGNGSRMFSYQLRGGEVYGYLQVGIQGAHRILLELPGTGITGLVSPFADRLGVAPDSRHAAIATVDGRLFILRLDGGVFASSGSSWRQLLLTAPAMPISVTPGESVVFVATEDHRLWRIPLADGGALEDVTPAPPLDPVLKDQLVLSGDGRSLAFLYGPRDLFSIYLCGESGTAIALPPVPAKYEEPGYLPEDIGGPRMMLNHDGSRLLYTDATDRDEIFLLDTSGATSATHLTGDLNFRPYIGIGILPSFIGGALVIAIGELSLYDIYSANTGVPAISNLTQSPGNVMMPFGEGILDLAESGPIRSGQLLARASHAGGEELLRLTPGVDSETVLDRVTGPLRRGIGIGAIPGYLISTERGDVLLSGVDGSPLFTAPPGIDLSRPVAGPDNSYELFLASIPGATALVARLSSGFILPILVRSDLRRFSLTGIGNLVLVGNGLEHLSASGTTILSQAGGPCWVLSGQGAWR